MTDDKYLSWRAAMLARTIGLDMDGSGDFDCVDMVKSLGEAYFPGVGWKILFGYGDAKDLYANANPTYFEKIPYQQGYIPERGMIAVFGSTPAPGYTNQFVNKYGHTGPIDSADINGYTLLQQESGTGHKPYLATWAWSYRPPIGFLKPKSQGGDDMIDSEDKARDVFLGILHEPNPTEDAIKSIINQPYSTVIPALVSYPKWKDQNDKLVAYPNLQAAVTGLQAQINANGNTELKEAIDKVIGLLEAKK